MPLQKQEIDIQISQGIDTKSDPKKVLPGRLLQLQNGIFSKPGEIRKANGWSAMTKSTVMGTSISSGNSIFSYGNQIVLHDGKSLFVYSESDAKWSNVSEYTHPCGLTASGAASVQVTNKALIRYGLAQSHPDMTVHSSGHSVVAWENANAGGVYYSIIDTESGNNILAGYAIPAITVLSDMHSPKVVSVGSYVFILVVNGSSLYAFRVDMSLPALGVGAPILVASDMPTTAARHFDVSVSGSTAIIAYTKSLNVGLVTLTSAGTVTPAATIAGTASGAITVFRHPSEGQCVVAWGESDPALIRFAVYGGTGYSSEIVSPTTIQAEACVGISGAGFSNGSIAFVWTLAPANLQLVGQYAIRIRVLQAGGSWLAPTADLRRSVGLAGKVYVEDGQLYIPSVYDSLWQPTIFLLDQSGMPVAKALTDVAAGQPGGPSNITLTNTLPEHNQSSGSTVFAWMEKVTVASSGIKAVTFRHGAKMTGAVLADALHFGRGLMWMYDGVSMVEHGFHVFPEVAAVPNPGGSFIYNYCTTFAWTDSQGNIHRSAPSVQVTQAQPAAIDATANAVHLTLPTLRLTRKPGNFPGEVAGAPVQIEVWRTGNGDTTFHRCHAVNQIPPFNDPNADFVSFIDGMTDIQIRANPELYTSGGVLENYPCNPPQFICQIRNRLLAIDETNPLVIWYSQEVAPGSPVEFSGPGSGTLTFNLESKGGATGLASLDDKIIVFRENSLSWIQGSGPAPTGVGSDFLEIPVPADAGCVDPGSIMVGGPGCMFKSNKGFHLLDRQMSTQYVGADVEAFNGQTVTSSAVLPKTNWAIFTLGNGTSLLFDYFLNQWSTLPAMSAVDSCIYKGRLAFLADDGTVYKETDGQFTANGSFMGLMAETSWLKMGSLSGLQRIYRLLVLGEWRSPHSLRVELFTDYDDSAPVQTVTFDSASPLVPYILRVQPCVQQCTALKVRLTELQNGTAGEGLSLSSLSLIAGVKPGLRRVDPSHTKG